MLSDLRFAFRTLARNRSFTLVTVLTLALGIGSAAAIFSVTDWILFRANTLPGDVYLIGGQTKQDPFMPIRFDFMVRAYQEQTDVFTAYAKGAYQNGNIVVDGQPVATSRVGVSAGFFSILEVAPALGRTFLPGEDVPGADQVVVVSYGFWQRHLGGKADVLGRRITVGDAICTVVGVLREGQVLPAYMSHDVYRPLTYKVNPAMPWEPNMFLLGKLRPGVTREQATLALGKVQPDLPPQLKQFFADDRAALASLPEINKQFRAEMYWVLLGAVGFLYAIACLNASNLMLVRMLGQRRELSIRLALGGGRWRIIRLLTVESVTLAVLASLAGLLIANWLFPLLMSVAGSSQAAPKLASWSINWRVAGVLGLLSVLTSLLIVILPAWRVLRADINSGLKDGGAALGEGRGLARLRGSFVVLQAAFAVILLAGAGLMIRTFQQLKNVDLGIDPAGRAKIQIGFPPDYPSAGEVRLARLREIQAELARVPGIRAVGFGTDFILAGFFYGTHSFEKSDGTPFKAGMMTFNLGYQEASGLKLKRGRWLATSNGNEIMVNEAFARALWPGEEPVGRLLRPTQNPGAGPEWKGWLVVGVVGDVRGSMREAPHLFLFCPEVWGAPSMNTFIVRFAGEFNESLLAEARRRLYAFDPRIVIHYVQPLSQVRDQQLWAERLADSVLKVLAGIALVLTVVGIFSVLAYTVDRRMGEFGVRLALGATRRNLVELVMRRGVLLTLLGIVLGLGGSLALTRYLKSLLFETSTQDPWVLAVVGVLLLITSVLACVLPARRATQVDITRLLRSE